MWHKELSKRLQKASLLAIKVVAEGQPVSCIAGCKSNVACAKENVVWWPSPQRCRHHGLRARRLATTQYHSTNTKRRSILVFKTESDSDTTTCSINHPIFPFHSRVDAIATVHHCVDKDVSLFVNKVVCMAFVIARLNA